MTDDGSGALDDGGSSTVRDPGQASSRLAGLGFRDPRAAMAHLETIRADLAIAGVASADVGGRDDVSRHAFPQHAAEAAAHAKEPDRALRDVAALVRRLSTAERRARADRPSSVTLHALRRAARIIATSPSLGNLLLEQPASLVHLEPTEDDGFATRAEGERAALARCLEGREDDVLRALRDFKHGRLLRILTLDLEGALDLDGVSHALSDTADWLLAAVLSGVSAQLGLGTPSPIGIVCYGKLGSREMSYASDTDIVFVYDRADGDYDEDLIRLARLANHWITTPTREGVLYATDFRLRPYGDSGMLVSSLGAFRDYQLNSAWTWEHQALTRARWLACSPALGRSLDAVKAAVLGRPRSPVQLRSDVLGMREKIFAAQRIPPGLFDVKHSRGGIVDVEFIVQHMILRHAGQHAELGRAVGNAEALARGAALGLVPSDLAQAVTAAYRQYRQWMHRERLSGNERVLIAPSEAAYHGQAVLALWQASFATAAGDPARPPPEPVRSSSSIVDPERTPGR